MTKTGLAACFALALVLVLSTARPAPAGERGNGAAKTQEESYTLNDAFYDKNNSYVILFNVITGELDDAVNHYFDSIGEEEYLPEKEGFRYQPFSFSSAAGRAITEAAAFPGKEPKLLIDPSVAAIQPVAKKVWDLLIEADAYYAGKAYTGDNFAKGKELHAVIDAATDELWPLLEVFHEHIDRMGELVIAQEIQDRLAEKYFISAAMMQTMTRSKAVLFWLNRQGIGDSNIRELDVKAFRVPYDALAQALAELEAAAKKNSALQEGLRATEVQSFIGAATKLKMCAANMITLVQNAAKKKPGAGVPGNELPSDYADQLSALIGIYNTIFK
ncbi:exported hypothetical protein [uncultured delta proteobacterium]|uniref:Imelysin-like domain-containing protein n=1 Tax=uncultured delta proteobacterium TaxID=34034 RepID=A0A212KA03_9DELT|nr:exported hypothetical protein [uncultured delta proteobacterium]